MDGGRIKMLRIEVDGHFHGSAEVPKPWVARIDGTDPKYGLRRDFVQKLNDWADARRACSGNLYGVVASFPLREGNLYEVSRLRGSSSKRHVAREFVATADGRLCQLSPIDALARVEQHTDPVTIQRLPEGDVRVHELGGVGAGRVMGWVVIDGMRHYRLRYGQLYETVVGDERSLVVGGPKLAKLDQRGALEWLAARA
jgi:hypothetical protein